MAIPQFEDDVCRGGEEERVSFPSYPASAVINLYASSWTTTNYAIVECAHSSLVLTNSTALLFIDLR